MRVFLSYRRGDAGGYAGRLTDTLIQHLGARSVFHDVTAISPGEDYTVAIERALADSDAALVVIGPGWLTVTSPQGARRLFEPGDYVRLELATILRRDIRAIPVLVGGARLPKAAELPDDLQALAQRQAVELHDETWREDVDGLLRSLRGEPAVPGNRRRRWLAAGVALIALLGLGCEPVVSATPAPGSRRSG
jgi:TIR domain